MRYGTKNGGTYKIRENSQIRDNLEYILDENLVVML
jgi:hypothetical protein